MNGIYGIIIGFSWIEARGFRKNLPFKSYGVKKLIANELELAASRFRALLGPVKHKDHLQDNLSVQSCFRRKVLVQPPRNKRDQRHH